MSAKSNLTNWSARALNPPKLTDQQWGVIGIAGVVLIVMAICQIVSFNDFSDILLGLGLSGPNVWAAIIIVAELWGSAMFFKIRLSSAFRMVSAIAAVLASGFWFVMNVNLISDGLSSSAQNSGYFGSYLAQSPGWWTVIEATALLLWVVYNLDLMRGSLVFRLRK